MRNPRRAYDKDGKPFTPGTIGQMIADNGIHHVTAYCETPGCGHQAKICVDTWMPDIFVPDIGIPLRCARCGVKGSARIMPCWEEWKAVGRP